MYSTVQILEILKNRKPDLQKRYPISELGLFGSYVRGDFNEKSDIDILWISTTGLTALITSGWHMNWKMR